MIIENKIYHHDEPNQLERYYVFLSEQCKLCFSNMHLVYLKPYKSPPSRVSITQEKYNLLKDNNCITELGYQEDIQKWIESLIHMVKAPIVQLTLTQ